MPQFPNTFRPLQNTQYSLLSAEKPKASIAKGKAKTSLIKRNHLFSPHLVDTKNIGAIVIADDHPIFRHAMSSCVAINFPSAFLLEVATLDELQVLLNQREDIDLVLLDLNMPGSHGLSALIHMRATLPGLSVVVISALEDPVTIQRALQLGAAGFIPKSSNLREITKAIWQVLSGSRYIPSSINLSQLPSLNAKERSTAIKIGLLTPQQFRIASMLTVDMLNKQIGDSLKIAEATVKVHMKAIMEKLEVYNRTQVALVMQTFEAQTGQIA